MITEASIWPIVEIIDAHLDDKVSQDYKDQPLAQDWARVAKAIEECGEAINELILYTGQNPRKPRDPEAAGRLMDELADLALTGIYGLQHFTKDIRVTRAVIEQKAVYHAQRMGLIPQ